MRTRYNRGRSVAFCAGMNLVCARNAIVDGRATSAAISATLFALCLFVALFDWWGDR